MPLRRSLKVLVLTALLGEDNTNARALILYARCLTERGELGGRQRGDESGDEGAAHVRVAVGAGLKGRGLVGPCRAGGR